MTWTLPQIQKTKQMELPRCEHAQEMLDTLVDGLNQYKITIEPIDYMLGAATVTLRFRLAIGLTAQKIKSRMLDIARILQANSVRFIPVIDGSNMLAIEAPRPDRQTVFFRDLIQHVDGNRLSFPVGLGIDGNMIFGDIAKMPHLLIAGATGQGKSVAINTIIASILSCNSPDDVRLLLLDPKVVEFMPYEGLPHLITKDKKIITDADGIINSLNSLVDEMESRYKILADARCRNIDDYITKGNKMFHIVAILDEFADISMQAQKEFETAITRLAAKARAAGIHLIIGTQRPSSDVVSSVIKANIPARWAFTTSGKWDSLTIIGEAGAEQLLGKGDSLFSQTGKIIRAQCPFVTDDELSELIKHWTSQQQENTDDDFILGVDTTVDQEWDLPWNKDDPKDVMIMFKYCYKITTVCRGEADWIINQGLAFEIGKKEVDG